MQTLYGEDAGIEATVRADKALYDGDIVGCKVWNRIVDAIGELERKVPNKAGRVFTLTPSY
jgi:hypothetical protein